MRTDNMRTDYLRFSGKESGISSTVKYILLVSFLVSFLIPGDLLALQNKKLQVDESNTPIKTINPKPHLQKITQDHVFIGGDRPIEALPDSLLFFQPVTQSQKQLSLETGFFFQKDFQHKTPSLPPTNALPVAGSTSETEAPAPSLSPGGPVGIDDMFKALADQTLSISASGFLANDIDLDGEELTATAILDNVDHGSLAAFSDGSFNYTPDPGFTGTDEFVYRMRDASFNSSDSVFVTIEVVEANRNPIGTSDSYTLLSNTTLSISTPGFLANDIDLDGEELTATAILDNVDHGSLAAFADGSFNYTPDPGFTGTDEFVYRMRDASFNSSDSVFVTFTVIEGNRAPRGTDDLFAAVENTTLIEKRY